MGGENCMDDKSSMLLTLFTDYIKKIKRKNCAHEIIIYLKELIICLRYF